MTDSQGAAVADGQRFMQTEVAKWVARGYAVETMTPTQTILSRKKKIGFFWNLVATLLTAGLWLIVIVIRIANKKTQRVVISVDPVTGAVHVS